MESSHGKAHRRTDDAGKRSAWGWLTMALTTGWVASRCQNKTRLVLGLGIAALGCWQSSRRKEAPEVEALEPVEPAKPQASIRTVPAARPGPGNWLLQVEPLPSVVEEGRRGLEMIGQGNGLLSEQPQIALEEPLDPNDLAWLNQGAEIPDAVELPELLGAPEPEPEPPSGMSEAQTPGGQR